MEVDIEAEKDRNDDEESMTNITTAKNINNS